MSNYEERSKEFGLASKEFVADTLKTPDAYVLDVRRQDEIDAQGKVEGKGHYVHVEGCTPSNCEALETAAASFLPEKDATVVIYCRSGRRACKAKEILESQGYKNVVNAGGYDDIKDLES